MLQRHHRPLLLLAGFGSFVIVLAVAATYLLLDNSLWTTNTWTAVGAVGASVQAFGVILTIGYVAWQVVEERRSARFDLLVTQTTATVGRCADLSTRATVLAEGKATINWLELTKDLAERCTVVQGDLTALPIAAALLRESGMEVGFLNNAAGARYACARFVETAAMVQFAPGVPEQGRRATALRGAAELVQTVQLFVDAVGAAVSDQAKRGR